MGFAGFSGRALAAGDPMAGDGSSGNPFQLTECAQLESIPNGNASASVYVDMMNDVDCSNIANYAPESINYDIIDGQNHSIYNLTVVSNTVHGGGLFVQVDHSTVQNLHLAGGTLTDNFGNYNGSIGITLQNSTITNVTSSMTISMSGPGASFVGGLFALLYDATATIRNSAYTGTINDNGDTVGGIAAVSSGNIYDSYTTGSIVAGGYAGGIVGVLTGATSNSPTDNGYIERSYSTMDVSSGGDVGGLVGVVSDQALIYDSFATGSLSGGSAVGTLIGSLVDQATNPIWLANDAYDTLNIPVNTTLNCIGNNDGNTDADTHCPALNDSDLTGSRNADVYSNWDFNNVWYLTAGYPKLSAYQTIAAAPSITAVTPHASNLDGELGPGHYCPVRTGHH